MLYKKSSGKILSDKAKIILCNNFRFISEEDYLIFINRKNNFFLKLNSSHQLDSVKYSLNCTIRCEKQINFSIDEEGLLPLKVSITQSVGGKSTEKQFIFCDTIISCCTDYSTEEKRVYLELSKL